MALVYRKNSMAPSKEAILKYMEKKKQEESQQKERRIKDMLNPYRELKKNKEPDEEFIKAQKKRERLLKKKEKLLQYKLTEERERREAEIEKKRREEEAKRIAEEREKMIRRQERFKKIAGGAGTRPVDKKMKEYIESIKMKKEAEKKRKLEEQRNEQEKKKLEEKAKQKLLLEEAAKKKALTKNSSLPTKNGLQRSRPSPSLITTTVVKSRSKPGEYSPTRPSIIPKPSSNKKPVQEYVPSKINQKEKASLRYSPEPDRSLIVYKPSKISRDSKVTAAKSEPRLRGTTKQVATLTELKRRPVLSNSSIGQFPAYDDDVEDITDEKIEKLKKELKMAEEIKRRREEEKSRARAMIRARQADGARQVAISRAHPMPSNKLPPIGLTYRRGMNFRKLEEFDEEEEDDEDMKDFIDDGDGYDDRAEDVSSVIKELFGYDKRKYAHLEDDDDIEEATFAQQMKEEAMSARAGLREDLEEMRKEKEEKLRKAQMRRKKQIFDSSDED